MRRAAAANGVHDTTDLTLLPNQTYPDYPDFGVTVGHRMETVFDVDSSVVYTHSVRLFFFCFVFQNLCLNNFVVLFQKRENSMAFVEVDFVVLFQNQEY